MSYVSFMHKNEDKIILLIVMLWELGEISIYKDLSMLANTETFIAIKLVNKTFWN